MSINLRPLIASDPNYGSVINLYKTAFTTVRHVPAWILRLKLRKGRVGFNSIYDAKNWVGLIDFSQHGNVLFVHFFAIDDSMRSGGYGSRVLGYIKAKYADKTIILNVENLDQQASNYAQRIKRRAFYENNGFVASGLAVQDSSEQMDMLIYGGHVTKSEVEDIYKSLYKGLWKSLSKPLFKPKVLNLDQSALT